MVVVVTWVYKLLFFFASQSTFYLKCKGNFCRRKREREVYSHQKHVLTTDSEKKDRLKDGHFARRTCQFSIAKNMGIFRSEILLSFLFSLAGKWVGFFLHAVSFSFIFFLLSRYTEFVVDRPPKSSAAPVFLGLGRSEFDTKSNSTHAIYIYI
jgi:hypothetical protein